MLGKTLEHPLDSKEIQPVYPKGNQSWIFIGRTDAEAEAPIHSPPDVKSRLIGKDPDAGKDWGQEEKGVTENEMVRWRHWLNGHAFVKLLKIVKDREAWCAIVHGVTKNQTWLSDGTRPNVRNLEKSIRTHPDGGSIKVHPTQHLAKILKFHSDWKHLWKSRKLTNSPGLR